MMVSMKYNINTKMNKFIKVGSFVIPKNAIKIVKLKNQMIYGHSCNVYLKDQPHKYLYGQSWIFDYPEITHCKNLHSDNADFLIIDFGKDYSPNSKYELDKFIKECKTIEECTIISDNDDLDYNLYKTNVISDYSSILFCSGLIK